MPHYFDTAQRTVFTEQLFCVQQRYSMSICRQEALGIEPRATPLHYRTRYSTTEPSSTYLRKLERPMRSRTPLHSTWKVCVNRSNALCSRFNFIKHAGGRDCAHLYRLTRPCRLESNQRSRLKLAYAGVPLLFLVLQLLLRLLYQFYYKYTKCF